MKPKEHFALLFLVVCLYGIFCSTLTFLFAKLLYKNCGKSESLKSSYNFKSNTDVEGDDLFHVHSSNLRDLEQICDAFDDCMGYNSNGWLKKSLNAHDSNQVDFYQKIGSHPIKSKTLIENTEVSEMLKSLKVYIYDTNIGAGLTPARVDENAVERIFVDLLKRSNMITQDPEKASFFFLPFRCSSYILSQSTELKGLKVAREIIGKILSEVQQRFPYWNRSFGADHFYICAHQLGAEVSGKILSKSIALLNSVDYQDPYFIPQKDISLPPSVEFKLEDQLLPIKGGSNIDPKTRIHLAYFAGDVKRGRIRPLIWDLWSMDPDIRIFSDSLSHQLHVSFLKQSRFCLILRGRKAWDSFLTESLLAGCIPVFISDHLHPPLQDTIDWSKISVTIPESDVDRLKSLLVSIPDIKVLNMQKLIAIEHKRFVWSRGTPVPYDAFHGVMLQLWRRRFVKV